MSTGDWYKFSVEKAGVYLISYDLLKKSGVDVTKVNPENIKIFGREGGMLPQSNAVPRPTDLMECSISVSGEADGSFDKGDYILFYAEGPDDYELDTERQIFRYENNLYSDKNFYFLTLGADAGKRINVSKNIAGDYPVITSFDDLAFYEKDEFNIEKSGREWFGEKFNDVSSYTWTWNLPGITAGSDIKIVSDVMGQSYTEASFKLFLNNVSVAEQKISPIPNGRYTLKGFQKRDTLSVSSSNVNTAGRAALDVKYEFVKGTGFSQGYLNFILMHITRDLALYDNQTIFLSGASLSNDISKFVVKQMAGNAQIWDITDHYNVQSQEFILTGTTAEFSASTTQLKKWVVFNNSVPEPIFVSKVSNQNLSGLATPNLLIITHSDFKSEAERLASHRTSVSNWSVLVATTEEIYNQFSGGRQDVSALRDFAKFLRDKDPDAFKAILFFGKGSYDYKDRLFNNTNFVATYQSRNSLHPLQTYSSDDFFAFLEEDEGEWLESPAQHHTLDVGIGRLPVISQEEARNIVDKIIDYETNQKTLGSWRKKIVFVADDGNSEDNFTSLHQYQADQLATEIDETFPAFDTRRLFLGSYKKHVQPNGVTAPGLADDIKRSFDLGALIINFTGHGSELVWADERVLTEKTIEELNNDLYPFLVTATCAFGRQDDPMLRSTAERSVTRRKAGSIGLVTTARPVNATTNFNLNEAFYQALLTPDMNGYATIGEVFRKTKNNSINGISNRNFSLIGDPSMVLGLPEYAIEVTSIKTSSGSDTLKALSTVLATGEIRTPNGSLADSFNGIVEATLYDKEKEYITIGNNDPPFKYQQWDNAIFRGKASAKAGKFEFTFVMPKNIADEVGDGKMSVYGFDVETRTEAKGVNSTVRIGGSENNVPGDATPPLISLFMGDTTFVNGGITTSDTYLIAQLQDDSGINISGYGTDNSITAKLDGDAAVYALNEYYISDTNTYRKGSVRFPILGLTPGRHTITVRASDVYNNPAEATIAFLVTDGDELVIEEFGNYPNPFTESTTLFLTHNRSGDDLEAQIFIFNSSGALLKSAEISVAASEYHINLMELNAWEDSGKKLPPGLYFARVIVRSMTNGSKNEKVTKLIVLN